MSAEASNQDGALRNFSQSLQAIADLNRDGKVTGEEAVIKTYDYLSTILFALDVLAGKATALPFVILPCDKDLMFIANCGNLEHTQIQASLFDIWDYKVSVEYEQFDGVEILGSEFIIPLVLGDFKTVAKLTLLDSMSGPDVTRVDYRIQSISNVTPIQVPEPSAALLFLTGLMVLWVRRMRAREPLNNFPKPATIQPSLTA
jgi:hypothetical protein